MDPFEEFPEDLILEIFKVLPWMDLLNCMKVSKRFRKLGSDHYVWNRPVSLSQQHIPPGALEFFLDSGVHTLDLSKSKIESPAFIDSPVFIDLCLSTPISPCRLQHLDLSMAVIAENTLADLLSALSRLKTLNLQFCSLNDNCLKYISQNKNLRLLNLSECQGITEDGLCTVADKCLNLEDLNLQSAWLDSSSLVSVLQELPPSVRKLNLRGHGRYLGDEALQALVQSCPELTELNISDFQITEVSFSVLVNTCHNIVVLHIPSSAICSRYIWRLGDLRKLTHLLVWGKVETEPLDVLLKHLPKVTVLSGNAF